MKRKIISMLMAMVILFTAVDLSVFASEATVSGNEVQSAVEEVTDNAEEIVESEAESEKDIVEGEIEDETIQDIMEEEKEIIFNSMESKTSSINAYGQCGENLTWALMDETLEIIGTGDMYDYSYDNNSPWYNYRNDIKRLIINEGVGKIGDFAFYRCSKLTRELKIPEGVTDIGDYAFYECEGFTGELKIPEGVTNIGSYAFYECEGFTGQLEIPEGVTDIGDHAFYKCSSFTGKLDIAESVRNIGYGAFGYCEGFIGSLIIPDSVVSLGNGAFYKCSGFTEGLQISNNITSIGERTFEGCNGFTGSIVIPDKVISIGSNAFKSCSGFTGVLTFPSNVESIGSSAFEDCTSLSGDIILPKSVNEIGENTFRNIKDVVIYGEKNSYVEAYADVNDFLFVASEINSSGNYLINVSVKTAEDLLQISKNVSNGTLDYKGYVIQIENDINLSGNSWTPIGNSSGRPFRGSIQGNGHTISGLNCSQSRSGLIGYWNVQDESYVKNLAIENIYLSGKHSGGVVASLSVSSDGNVVIRGVDVTGSINGTSLIAGGMVGVISAGGNGRIEILECDVDVSIYSGGVWNDAHGIIGGIVGQAGNTKAGELVILDCTAKGDLVTEQTYGYCTSEAGGLIGLSQVKSVTIERSSKKGSISCKAYYTYMGGFIGNAVIDYNSEIKINNCYIYADMKSICTNGTDQGGGVIGHTSGQGGSNISISKTFVTGSMSADNKAAFVCWHCSDECPVIKNCYFDINMLGIQKGEMVSMLGFLSGTWLNANISNSGGLSTANMKLQSSYADWDFDNIWKISKEENDGYPIVQRESETENSSGNENIGETEIKTEINKKGNAYTTFLLKDNNGRVKANQAITYQFEDGIIKEGKSNEKGYVTIESPMLMNTTGEEETYTLIADISLLLEDGTTEKLEKSVSMQVEVLPLSFSQKWELGVEGSLSASIGPEIGAGAGAANASVSLAKAEIEGSLGGTMMVENAYEDGKRNLTLEQTYEAKVAAKGEVGPAAEAKMAGNKLKVGILSAEGNVAVGTNMGVGLKIEGYDPNNTEDLLDIGKFLLGSQAQAEGNLFILLTAKYLGFDYYNQLMAGNELAYSVGAAAGSVKFGETAVGVASFDVNTMLSYLEALDETDNTLTRKYGIAEEVDSNVLNVEIGDFQADIFSGTAEIENEITAAIDYKNNIEKFSIKKSYIADADAFEIFHDNVKIKGVEISYSDEELERLIQQNQVVRKFTEGSVHYILGNEKQKLFEYLDDTPVKGVYKETIEEKNIAKVGLDIGAKLGVGVGLDVEFEGVSACEYETKGGIYSNGIVEITNKNDIDEIVENESIGILDLFGEAVVSVANKLKNWFVDVAGDIAEGVENVCAKVESAVGIITENAKKWVLHVVSLGKYEDNAQTMQSYAITAYSYAYKMNSADATIHTEVVEKTAYTVGEPYYVYVTDDEGNEISDYSENPLTLTLQYSDEMLEAAGAGENETGRLAIYRYSEEYLGYEYLGGIVDTLNKNVSVDIMLPGQYVLAVDNAEPLITSFKVSDASKTPTITIGLEEFSEFNEFSMKIDEIEIITTETWKNYFNKNQKTIVYSLEEELEDGIHTVSIYAVDGVGNAMAAPALYEFVVDSAPIIKDVKLALSEKQMRIRVWSDDTDIENVKASILQVLTDGTKLRSECILGGAEGYFTDLVNIEEGLESVQVTITVKDTYGNISKSVPIIKTIEEREEGVENDLWMRLMDGEGADGQAYPYTGQAIKPTVRVYDGTTLLKEKADYTISYKNNTNANDGSKPKTAPTITITGKGNYSGKVTKTFVIQPKSLEHEDIAAADLMVKANNKVQKPAPVVKDGTKTLKNKTHYTLEYPDQKEDNPGAYKEAGEYRILVRGKGNYGGTKTVKLIITEKNPISKATVTSIKNRNYTGEAIEPKVTVKYNKTTLKEGMDYTLTYENNIHVGTATAVIIGKGNYAGEKRIDFRIVGASISKAKVTGIPKSMPFTGNEITVNTQGWGAEPVLTLTVNGETKTLTEGTDYTISYLKNTTKGTASIVFTGMGGYSGTLKKNFSIKAYDIGADSTKQMTVHLTEKVFYEKGGSKPKPLVMYGNQILEEGKDYTLSYRNNTTANDGSDAKKLPTVIIKGKGNYTGNRQMTFVIEKEEISYQVMAVADRVYQNRKNTYKSAPVIATAEGTALRAGTDYEKTYTYSYKEDSLLSDGITIRKAGEIVGETDIPTAGTVIVVTVKGKGNYTGTLSGEYRIVKQDISKAKVFVTAYTYTGKEITPDQNEIVVKIGKQELGAEDYKIVGYTNNVKKGTAKMTLKGMGEYGGTKTVNFSIRSKSMFWWLGL